MGRQKHFVALIPAYQPEDVLISLLETLWQLSVQTVVVDDGSGTSFSALFQRAAQQGTVLVHSENKGKGEALKTGLRYIKEHLDDNCVVVTMDADGQHQPLDAIHLCEAADTHRGTLILGKRKLHKKVPLRSQFGNILTRMVYRGVTGLGVYDTQSGLRAFHIGMVNTLLNIPGERYEYEMNVLLHFARQKLPIKELEISTIYQDNNAVSHFHVFRDSYMIYAEIVKFSASSLVSFLIDFGLFSLLTLLTVSLGTWGITISNVGARVVSASVNYMLNRKFVFYSDKSVAVSAIQYFLLAMVILLGNTFVLKYLVTNAFISPYWAKLITEVFFFILSWFIQRFLIFNRKKGGI